MKVSDDYLRMYEQPREAYRRMLENEPGLQLGVDSNPPRIPKTGKLYDMAELLDNSHDYPRVPIILDFIAWSRKHGFTHPRSMLSTDPNDPDSCECCCDATWCVHGGTQRCRPPAGRALLVLRGDCRERR